MFKRFVAVAAVALFVAVPSTHAYWGYFSVIDAGSAEAKLTYDGGEDLSLKVRFGIIDNLEVTAATYSPYNMNSSFSIGARYQVLPEMLSLSLDLGIPTLDEGEADFGIAPSVQFHYGINDMISIGVGAGLGIDINRIKDVKEEEGDIETEAYMNLGFGLELDFQLTENFGFGIGCDFALDLSYEAPEGGDDAELEVFPWFGIYYTAGNLTVGTDIGIDLYRTSRERARLQKGTDPGDAVGLTASVYLSLEF